MHVVFPMRINYSSVFNELQKRADQWKAGMDFKSVNQREVGRLQTSGRPQIPILRHHTKGRVINIRA
ncbi:MAG: hypothetical protein EOM20_10060 [Spartobacteria bacterium]|nr:hypothetical protein [Spartobacteria bacterium]